MRALLALSLSLAAVSCPTPQPRPPVEFALTIGTRQSCGILSGLDYDTSCLGAIALRIIDTETATTKFTGCKLVDQDVDGALASFIELRDIVQADPVIFEIGGFQAAGKVRFELVGLHQVDVESPANLCERPFGSEDEFLFFGRSAEVNLDDYADGVGPPLVEIALDCRDCTFNDDTCNGAQQCRFGCGGIAPIANPNICPAVFPSSLCVPNGGCAKPCDEDVDCFEDKRTCREDGFCDTTTNGAFCSPCSDAISCADNLVCVRKPSGGGSFCALPCPDEPCPSGTKCTRIGNDLVLD